MTTTQNDSLLQTSARELFATFKTLEAPALTEMHGEYAARILAQPSPLGTLMGRALLANPVILGKWLCKAFRPVDDAYGRGYNTFERAGEVLRKFPMQTLVAPSRWDAKPAYHLVYRAYRSFCGDIHMVDELRRFAPGIYLGMGTWGFTRARRHIPLPFMLSGPVGTYRGDCGKERAGFSLREELPGLR